MPCDTLAEFRDLARYRKSFNGDLMMAKSRPQKFYYFETFPFESAKGPLLVLGKIDKALLDEVKKLGKTVKAKGLCSFKDNVVALTVTDGKLDESQLKKALALANVRREGTVGTGDAGPGENKGKGDALGAPSEKFTAARDSLRKLVEGADKLAWNERDIKSGAEADDKIKEVKRFILDVESAVTAGEAAAKALATQLKAEAREPRAKFFQADFNATHKLMARQEALVKDAEKEVAGLRRRLIALELLGKELNLAGRVVELRVRSAMLKYSVHGDKTKTLHNEHDVLKALGAEVLKLAGAAKPTASNFLNPELEQEAVDRAVAIAQKQCPWTEVQTDGRWAPLNSLVVFVGKPAQSMGWNFVDKPDAAGDTIKVVAEAIAEFCAGKASPDALKGKVGAALLALDELVKGRSKAPMVRSARVMLARSGGRWASVSHYPDRAAMPPGWNIKGKTVRLKADAPGVSAPACSGA